MKVKMTIASAALLIAAGTQASITDFGLGGNVSYDGWDNLTGTENPGVGSYPGAAAWPFAIGSMETGSGDAALMKESGTGYPGSAGIYSSAGGVFSISDSTALANVQTIVLAFDYGAGSTPSFTSGPSLTLNGSTVLGAADRTLSLGSREDTIAGNEVTIFTEIYQWDLQAEGTVNSFSVEYDVGEHAQQYAIQLEQSDVYSAAIPEPATMALFGGAGLALAFLRRMKMY
ncbi:PEP-CTERM sorting domain-containing protein [Pontiellaceae bacterium B12219]|nr:PEP-CTERM sorting domain-containing protein [Pontiellaceae bacterium B12219]